MSLFTERLVPDGWTRGEELEVRRLYGKNLSTVATIRQSEITPFGEISPNHIAYIGVFAGQEKEAEAWLKWWNE